MHRGHEPGHAEKRRRVGEGAPPATWPQADPAPAWADGFRADPELDALLADGVLDSAPPASSHPRSVQVPVPGPMLRGVGVAGGGVVGGGMNGGSGAGVNGSGGIGDFDRFMFGPDGGGLAVGAGGLGAGGGGGGGGGGMEYGLSAPAPNVGTGHAMFAGGGGGVAAGAPPAYPGGCSGYGGAGNGYGSAPAGANVYTAASASALDYQSVGGPSPYGVVGNGGNGGWRSSTVFGTAPQAMSGPAPPVVVTSAPSRTLLRLRDIKPVQQALARMDPQCSGVMVTLDRLLMSNGPAGRYARTSAANPDVLRARVMDFRGFPANVHPDVAILTTLSRQALDSLAWAFAVNRAGRKADVARRIVEYLRAPLAWAEPTKRRCVAGVSASGRGGNAVRHAPRMPYNGPTPPGAHAGMYRRLVTDLNSAHDAPGEREGFAFDFGAARRGSHNGHPHTTTSSAARAAAAALASVGGGNGGPRASAGRGPPRGLPGVRNVLKSYDFQNPENPFHLPVGSPLGNTDKFIVFSADELSSGKEPRLVFSTPSPPSPEDGVEVQVNLRCLKAESGKHPQQWIQSWPFPAVARVNRHQVELNQAQRYTSGKLCGIDMATNLSPFLRKHKPNANEMNEVILRRHASTAAASKGVFVVYAQVVRVKSVDLVRSEVLEQSRLHWMKLRDAHSAEAVTDKQGAGTGAESGEPISTFELAKSGVVKFMTADDDVRQSSMRVSLRCPLMLSRMVTPVKGRRCTHLQCFDLDNFLHYARANAKFECPVCNKRTATPDELLVSPYIEKALELFQCEDVDIDMEGQLTAVASKRRGAQSDNEDSDGEGGGGSGGGGGGGGSGGTDGGTGGGTGGDGRPANGTHGNNGPGSDGHGGDAGGDRSGVVDLTLSDDEGAGPGAAGVSDKRGDATNPPDNTARGLGPISYSPAGDAPPAAWPSTEGVGEPATANGLDLPSFTVAPLPAPASAISAPDRERDVATYNHRTVASASGATFPDPVGAAADASVEPPAASAAMSQPSKVPVSSKPSEADGLYLFDQCVEPDMNAAWSIDVIALDSD